jgi:hypothetical protein
MQSLWPCQLPVAARAMKLEEHGTLTASTRVQLYSLQGVAHLNGRTGHILGLDTESGRLAVELELAQKGDGHSIKAKEANLFALTARPKTAETLQELVDLAGDSSSTRRLSGRDPAGQIFQMSKIDAYY